MMGEEKESAVTRWEPFRELEEWEPSLSRFPSRLGRLFEDFERGWPALRQGLARPAMDISEDDAHFTVAIELPGVKKEDVTVEVVEGRLTVRGEKKSEREEKKERARFCERSFGAFSRSFRLPADADDSHVSAKYEDGVLTLEIPKKEEAKPKTINIR